MLQANSVALIAEAMPPPAAREGHRRAGRRASARLGARTRGGWAAARPRRVAADLPRQSSRRGDRSRARLVSAAAQPLSPGARRRPIVLVPCSWPSRRRARSCICRSVAVPGTPTACCWRAWPRVFSPLSPSSDVSAASRTADRSLDRAASRARGRAQQRARLLPGAVRDSVRGALLPVGRARQRGVDRAAARGPAGCDRGDRADRRPARRPRRRPRPDGGGSAPRRGRDARDRAAPRHGRTPHRAGARRASASARSRPPTTRPSCQRRPPAIPA